MEIPVEAKACRPALWPFARRVAKPACSPKVSVLQIAAAFLILVTPISTGLSRSLAAWHGDSALSDYAGTWVRKVRGQNFLVVTLKVVATKVSGSLALPKSFDESEGGEVYSISSEVNRFTIFQASVLNDHLDFVAQNISDPKDQTRYFMTLVDDDHGAIEPEGWGLAPWRLERMRNSSEVSVATNWPEPGPKVVSPEIAALQAELRKMATEDQAADVPPYSAFDKVCEDNYPKVLHIYEQYGWPRISIVGTEAASDFWLLAVHQTPHHLEFVKRALRDMKLAVDTGEASKANYALFEDSVLQAEGKPQHWGTKTVCKDGKLVLYPVDDQAALEHRRNDLQLMPLDKYLKMLQPSCTK